MSHLPCIFCHKDVEVTDWSGMNKVYYPPDGATYAYHTAGCDGKGAGDTDEILARIAQIGMSWRMESMYGSPGR